MLSFFRYLLPTVVLIGLVNTGFGQAVDIYVKDDITKPFKKAEIASESVRGVQLKGNNIFISANDLYDINYATRITTASVRVGVYGRATTAEREAREATKPGDKADGLLKAANLYKAGIEKLPANVTFTKRHFAFKSGYLKAQAALIGGKDYEKAGEEAAAELTAFKKANDKSWQYTLTMLTLARLQLHNGNSAAARKLYSELAKHPGVPDDVRNEVSYREAKMLMAENNFTGAKKTLTELIPNLTKGSIQSMQAKLDEIVCMAELNQRAQAISKLKVMQKEIPANKKEIKALVYNTLGELYFRESNWQEARWPFLWVDVIYNEDPSEHAKALYYLYKIFNELNEIDRAEECFNTLTEDARFTNSEYRQKAMKEREKAG